MFRRGANRRHLGIPKDIRFPGPPPSATHPRPDGSRKSPTSISTPSDHPHEPPRPVLPPICGLPDNLSFVSSSVPCEWVLLLSARFCPSADFEIARLYRGSFSIVFGLTLNDEDDADVDDADKFFWFVYFSATTVESNRKHTKGIIFSNGTKIHIFLEYILFSKKRHC